MQRKLMAKLVTWKTEKGRKPLIIKGVRQVGKTFLLKEFGKTHFPKAHYINFEKEPRLAQIFEQDLVPNRILETLSFALNSKIEIGRDLVIFDEIQEAPKALTSLKYFQEECPKLHICAAGSLLGLHLHSTSFPVGKVSFETLRPLSFEEFLFANNDKALPFLEHFNNSAPLPEIVHDHLWKELKHYFIVGGLPEVITTYLSHK
jgi:predicted AAA+ superfamily ATPase